jgi:transposase
LRAFVREAWVLRWPWKGLTTREIFETYVEHFLAPTLGEGQIVVMDNLGAYKPERMRQLIEARGCELIHLPSYSPDLNPIVEAFSKVKHILRKIGARTKQARVEALGLALGAVSAQDTGGYYAHCGYRTPAQ